MNHVTETILALTLLGAGCLAEPEPEPGEPDALGQAELEVNEADACKAASKALQDHTKALHAAQKDLAEACDDDPTSADCLDVTAEATTLGSQLETLTNATLSSCGAPVDGGSAAAA